VVRRALLGAHAALHRQRVLSSADATSRPDRRPAPGGRS
jgi:hypothetical protein